MLSLILHVCCLLIGTSGYHRNRLVYSPYSWTVTLAIHRKLSQLIIYQSGRNGELHSNRSLIVMASYNLWKSDKMDYNKLAIPRLQISGRVTRNTKHVEHFGSVKLCCHSTHTSAASGCLSLLILKLDFPRYCCLTKVGKFWQEFTFIHITHVTTAVFVSGVFCFVAVN